MIPHSPTPDWGKSQFDKIVKCDDPEALQALLELLAVIAPTEQEEKYKYEIAWAVIQHGYRRTADCDKSCRRYLGIVA